MSTVTNRDKRLYNSDLAPTADQKKNWGWFEIFNVWANDVQSLFGYTLAASLFLASGLNGWAVFLALILAGFFIMWLVNLSGKPSVKHGIPFPVFVRSSMGVFGANFPAMARGIVAMFWYGAQTYAASTAVALLLTALTGSSGSGDFLGMSNIMWISFIFVSAFQIYLFWQGIDLIRKFLNFAGPAVYIVMIVLMLAIWIKAGGGLLSEVGEIFSGGERSGGFEGLGSMGAFLAVFGIMVGYFAAVVINFGDFSRFVKNEKEMKKGNLYGLVGNIVLFSFITLMITGGTIAVPPEFFEGVASVVSPVPRRSKIVSKLPLSCASTAESSDIFCSCIICSLSPRRHILAGSLFLSLFMRGAAGRNSSRSYSRSWRQYKGNLIWNNK